MSLKVWPRGKNSNELWTKRQTVITTLEKCTKKEQGNKSIEQTHGNERTLVQHEGDSTYGKVMRR